MSFLETDGKMKTKEDIICWLHCFLPEDFDYLDQSAAAYIKEIRALEALLRPMWGVIPLMISKETTRETSWYIQELKNCLKKQSLPKLTAKNRQIAVEMAVLAYGIGIGGQAFLDNFDDAEQNYLFSWLNTINSIELPLGNWYFFSVLINTALKINGARYDEAQLTSRQEAIEELYLGDGWYSDGKNQQRDYYTAFAFHFYGLLYSMMTEDAWAEKYKTRAALFAGDFICWFDPEGRSLPYGRSLTYRFAHVAFWSALIVSDVYKDTKFTLGEIKGVILRNFRWWQKQNITLPKEKNLSIGYAYSNLILSEDYNAPGSPMWAFKPFIILALPKGHIFWQTPELPYPKIVSPTYQKHCGFIICGDEKSKHHAALSGRQFSSNPKLLHHREKYGKFAYSTYFGFNLSRDIGGIEQTALDSMLSLSIAGLNQFAGRGRISRCCYENGNLKSFWSVPHVAEMCTTLIPISADCHIRLHEVLSNYELDAYEGGFPLFSWNKKYNQEICKEHEVYLKNTFGVSGIADLLGKGTPIAVPQNPNTNIYNPEKNAVPAVYCKLAKGRSSAAVLVFASPDSGSEFPSVECREEEQAVLFNINGNEISVAKQFF